MSSAFETETRNLALRGLVNFESAMDRFSISRLLESASVEPTRAAPPPVGGLASGAAAPAGEAAATCEQQALLWASALGLAVLSAQQAPASALAPAHFALPTGPNQNPNPNASCSSTFSTSSSSSSAAAAAAIDPQALSYLTYLAYFLSQIGSTPFSDASFCATPTSGSFSSSSSSSASSAGPAAGYASGACFSIGDLYGLAAAAMLCPEQIPRTPEECTQPLLAAPADLLRSPASTATERSQLVGSESGCAPDWSAASGTLPSRLQRKQLHQQQHQQQLFYQALLWQQVRRPFVFLICVQHVRVY